MIQITTTEVATSLTMYFIIHGILWVGRNVEKFAYHEYHHILIKHKRGGHKGHLHECKPCLTGTNLAQLVVSEPL